MAPAVDPAVLRRRRLITFTVMAATIMHALDGTIANVALPSIQGSLSATQEQVSWVVTSYIVASAILTPLAGFCAMRFGLRRTLATCVIGIVNWREYWMNAWTSPREMRPVATMMPPMTAMAT